MSKLQRVDAAVDKFLAKASKKNKPLEAFRETESFKQFEQKMRDALQSQAKWVSKNLKDIDVLSEDDVSEKRLKDELGAWIYRNMPRTSTYISEQKVYTYLHNAFVFSVEAQLKRLGLIVKADSVDFKLTNEYYIAGLKNQANYLLNKSKIDDTTTKSLVNIIADRRMGKDTIDEIAREISSDFEGISEGRAFVIANTETNQAMSSGQQAYFKENGVTTKSWVPAGGSTCDECEGNADDGPIGIDESYSSGDMHPPAHPSCECYEDGGEIDLDAIDIWDGS